MLSYVMLMVMSSAEKLFFPFFYDECGIMLHVDSSVNADSREFFIFETRVLRASAFF